MIMRYAPLVLFIGILFNLVCVVVFRLRLDRKYRDQFEEYKISLASDVHNLSRDALSAIDGYFVSNYNHSVSAPLSASLSAVDNPSRSFADSGDWFFDYFEHDNVRYARVGIRNYREGDVFPRGGFITSIHPDGVLVDGEYWFRNSPASSPRLTSNTTTQTLNGGLKK